MLDAIATQKNKKIIPMINLCFSKFFNCFLPDRQNYNTILLNEIYL